MEKSKCFLSFKIGKSKRKIKRNSLKINILSLNEKINMYFQSSLATFFHFVNKSNTLVLEESILQLTLSCQSILDCGFKTPATPAIFHVWIAKNQLGILSQGNHYL